MPSRVLSPLITTAMPEVGVAQAGRIARDEFAIEPRRVWPISGERDRNFRIESVTGTYVLKFVDPSDPAEVSWLQSAALRHIADVAPTLPVPRVLPSAVTGEDHVTWGDPEAPLLVRCVTFIEGRPLGDVPASARQRVAVGEVLARLDLALEGFEHEAADRRLAWDAQRAHLLRPLADAIEGADHRALVHRALDRFEACAMPRLAALRRQVIHNDFNPQNVLVTSLRSDVVAGVIDFGDMLRAPRVQDLATACAYQPLDGDDPLEVVVQIASGYHCTAPLDEDETRVLVDLIVARLALSAMLSAARAREDPANRVYLERNQGLVRANLRALMAMPGSAGPERLSAHLSGSR